MIRAGRTYCSTASGQRLSGGNDEPPDDGKTRSVIGTLDAGPSATAARGPRDPVRHLGGFISLDRSPRWPFSSARPRSCSPVQLEEPATLVEQALRFAHDWTRQ